MMQELEKREKNAQFERLMRTQATMRKIGEAVSTSAICGVWVSNGKLYGGKFDG